MIENQEKPSEYFSRNADSWLADAYSQSGFNYPTPYHRLRIVKGILSQLSDVGHIMDVGCGGGQLAVAMAEQGAHVVGVDQSDEMLSNAKTLIAEQSAEIQSRVSFVKSSLEDLGDSEFDALTSMGVIGYLPSDDDLFQVANRSLRSNGYFIVSFRNRLFNLFSLSHRTLAEIESGEFVKLYAEAGELYQQLSVSDTRLFLKQIHEISGALLNEGTSLAHTEVSPSEQQGQTYSSQFEARQTTPAQARQSAQRCGFDVVSLHGVHPHLSAPGLNQMLPPQVYNRLSDSLLPLEETPISLIWSSVFIGVFRKQN